MTSMFHEALGAEFDRLHPMLQRRFGVGLDAGYACIGRGTMLHIRRGPWWTIPFLRKDGEIRWESQSRPSESSGRSREES